MLARPCTGHDPLIFEAGRCFRCGRLLESELGLLEAAADEIALGALAHAVDQQAEELRREARDAGYFDTPERYLQWLEARYKFDTAREEAALARPAGRSRDEKPLRGVGASVRSPLAPVVL
jgi:hypothetical protein